MELEASPETLQGEAVWFLPYPIGSFKGNLAETQFHVRKFKWVQFPIQIFETTDFIAQKSRN